VNKISVVITTVDGEEKHLASCLASVKNFVNEIVIIDLSSGKKIENIAKKFKSKIFKHPFVNYVEPVRNFGINKATGNWVLVLDPDEEIPLTLINKLKQVVENNEADYVRIPRRNIVFGKALKHSRWWPDYNIRFFKKGHLDWDKEIHGIPIQSGKGVDLEVREEFAIIHHNYETIEQFIERMNRYTSVQAESKSKHYKFSAKDLITKPAAEFLSRFFAAEGYKDGVHGLALSFLQAFYELVVYLKIWQIEKFKDETLSLKEITNEIKKVKKEFNYWENDTLVKEGSGIIPRIRRKFKV